MIKKQDVEVREAILELERQLAEKEEKQCREIDNVKSREEAEIQKVRAEERLKSETIRILTEESLAVQEENKQRLIIIAVKNKDNQMGQIMGQLINFNENLEGIVRALKK